MAAATVESLVLLDLPMEIILTIASHLPPSNRVLFALTCKRIWMGTTRLSSVFPPMPENKGSRILGIPKELPSDIDESDMSDAWMFQPERWEFLRLLEKDLHDNWQLCHDCFILHPSTTFTPSDQSFEKSCRAFSRQKPRKKMDSRSISGIVDLCPCFSLTPAKRDVLQSLKDHKLPAGREQEVFRYWHQCRHTYDDMQLEMCSWPVLDRQDGLLGYHINYSIILPSFRTDFSCPRWLCPHARLQDLISDWESCRADHFGHAPYVPPLQRRCCKVCRATLTCTNVDSTSVPGFVRYEIEMERRLDLQGWGRNVAFPYARQKRREMEGMSLEWDEWFKKAILSNWMPIVGRNRSPWDHPRIRSV